MNSKANYKNMKRQTRRTSSSDETRKRILDVAEELFGQRGVYAVSLREMNAACGMSQGVLHYHFGGREPLVEAILERSLSEINRARRQMVDGLLLTGKIPNTYQIAEVIVVPMAEYATASSSGQRFVRFLGRLHQDNNEIYLEKVNLMTQESNINRLLALKWPDLDPRTIEILLEMTVDVMFGTLTTLDSPYRGWQTALRNKPTSSNDKIQQLINFIARGINITENNWSYK